MTRTQELKGTRQHQPWLQLTGKEAPGCAWLLARSQVPRDEIPMSKMSSKEKESPTDPCKVEMAGRGEMCFSSPANPLLRPDGKGEDLTTAPCSCTRMMPNKADRYGLTDSGRMRDKQRCGPSSKGCGDATSNQAITGSFTSVIAGPRSSAHLQH